MFFLKEKLKRHYTRTIFFIRFNNYFRVEDEVVGRGGNSRSRLETFSLFQNTANDIVYQPGYNIHSSASSCTLTPNIIQNLRFMLSDLFQVRKLYEKVCNT